MLVIILYLIDAIKDLKVYGIVFYVTFLFYQLIWFNIGISCAIINLILSLNSIIFILNFISLLLVSIFIGFSFNSIVVPIFLLIIYASLISLLFLVTGLILATSHSYQYYRISSHCLCLSLLDLNYSLFKVTFIELLSDSCIFRGAKAFI